MTIARAEKALYQAEGQSTQYVNRLTSPVCTGFGHDILRSRVLGTIMQSKTVHTT